jgi:hypothetical protein
MSLSRLRSQLEYNSSVSDLNIWLRKTPVVLSDSKARNPRDEVARGIEKDIVWWYKGGEDRWATIKKTPGVQRIFGGLA